jgi:hypothetical protein
LGANAILTEIIVLATIVLQSPRQASGHSNVEVINNIHKLLLNLDGRLDAAEGALGQF